VTWGVDLLYEGILGVVAGLLAIMQPISWLTAIGFPSLLRHLLDLGKSCGLRGSESPSRKSQL